MEVTLTNIYIFLVATTLAILEIQIEGSHGWAKNLPTWRPGAHNWFVKFYGKLMSGREFTGYHLTMFAFVLLILHLPYVFGFPLTINHELRTISLFFIFIVLWDFLWFVLNPYYPLKQFKKEYISWHPKWFLGAPADYWFSLLISFLIIIPTGDFKWWFTNIASFGIQTLIVILFTLYVLKIDNWHKI